MPQTRRRRATHLEPLEYQQLASFRYSLRTYLRFSEAAAEKLGLTAQHYQALLAVCAAPGGVTINDLAQQLLIETEDHRRLLIDASEVLTVIRRK